MMEMRNIERDEQILELQKKARLLASRSYADMEKQVYMDGAIKRKDKELIAIGISVVKNRESYIEWHIKQALDEGATSDEIIEAIEVGIEVRGGPDIVVVRSVLNILMSI
jgi:AhpD family alkylhydroperoxidase